MASLMSALGNRPSEAQIDDLGIVVGGASNGQGDVGIGAGALRIKRLQRQNLHIRSQPGHAHAVVGRGRDDAGHVCAVAVVVGRVSIVIHIIPARRQTPGELGMREGDAGVDHRHQEGIGAEGEIPRRRRAHAAHVPLVADIWIGGVAGGACEIVRLGVAHPRQRRQPGALGLLLARRHRNPPHAVLRLHIQNLQTRARRQALDCLLPFSAGSIDVELPRARLCLYLRVRLPADHDFAGHVRQFTGWLDRLRIKHGCGGRHWHGGRHRHSGNDQHAGEQDHRPETPVRKARNTHDSAHLS